MNDHTSGYANRVNEGQIKKLKRLIEPLADDSPLAILAVLSALLGRDVPTFENVTAKEYRAIIKLAHPPAAEVVTGFKDTVRDAYRTFRESKQGQLRLPGIDS